MADANSVIFVLGCHVTPSLPFFPPNIPLSSPSSVHLAPNLLISTRPTCALSLNASLLLLHVFGSPPPPIAKTLSSVAATTSSLRGKREDGKSAEFTASKQDRDRDLPTPQVNSATLLPLFPTGEQARNVCSLFSGIFMESAQRGKKIKPVPYLTDTLVFTPPPGEGGLLKPCVTHRKQTNIESPPPSPLSNSACAFLSFSFSSSGAVHRQVLWAEHSWKDHLLHRHPGTDNQHRQRHR